MEITERLIKHVQPTQLNSSFTYDGISFAAYLSAVSTMLHTVNEKCKLGDCEKTLAYNTPFEIKPKKPNGKGALLVHGLFDTPFIMRDVGQHLADQGFLVRSILLPGHATIPADLLTTSVKDWQKATEFGVKSFANKVDSLYLVGFSTGASLELNYVLEHGTDLDNIAGLIMLCPAFAINARKSLFLRLYRMVRWMIKGQKWIFRHENPDYTKYTSFPVNSAYLVQRVIIENTLLLKQSDCKLPIFMVLSEDDETVRADIALNFFKQHYNTDSRLIYYSNNMHNFLDSRIKLTPSAVPEKNILNLSHISIPNAPSNHHYGVDSDYKETISEPKHAADNNALHFGASTPENEQQYRLQRITYNPFFKEMMASLDEFLA
jgi:esterase/lipase